MENEVIKKAISICGSQVNLAEKCGVSQAAVSYWLSGSGINSMFIPRIAAATNNEISEIEILNSLQKSKQ